MTINTNIRQTTFDLKDGAKMKKLLLLKDNSVCYSYRGEDEEGMEFPHNYAHVFSKDDNNIVYLNGEEFGVLGDDELLSSYAHSVIQSQIVDKTLEEAIKFTKEGVIYNV